MYEGGALMRYENSEAARSSGGPRGSQGRQAASLVMLFEHRKDRENIHKHEERQMFKRRIRAEISISFTLVAVFNILQTASACPEDAC